MSYLKRKFKSINCDIFTKVISLLIALHIIISLIVIGSNNRNKKEFKKPEITNQKTK